MNMLNASDYCMVYFDKSKAFAKRKGTRNGIMRNSKNVIATVYRHAKEQRKIKGNVFEYIEKSYYNGWKTDGLGICVLN